MQEVEVEGECGEGVVEIMRDAASQLAENLGALRLLDLIGEPFLFGDVFQAEEDTAFAAVGNGCGRGEEDGVAAGVAGLWDFEVELCSVGGTPLSGVVEGAVEDLGGRVWRRLDRRAEERVDRFSDGLRIVEAEEFAGAAVEAAAMRVAVEEDHGNRRAIVDGLQLGLTVREGALGLALPGDVGRGEEPPEVRPVRIQVLCAKDDVHELSILAAPLGRDGGNAAAGALGLDGMADAE